MENNTDSFIIFTMTPYWHKGSADIGFSLAWQCAEMWEKCLHQGSDHNFTMFFSNLIFKDGREVLPVNLIQKKTYNNIYTIFRVTLFSHLGWKRGGGRSQLSLKLSLKKHCEIVISSLTVIMVIANYNCNREGAQDWFGNGLVIIDRKAGR